MSLKANTISSSKRLRLDLSSGPVATASLSPFLPILETLWSEPVGQCLIRSGRIHLYLTNVWNFAYATNNQLKVASTSVRRPEQKTEGVVLIQWEDVMNYDRAHRYLDCFLCRQKIFGRKLVSSWKPNCSHDLNKARSSLQHKKKTQLPRIHLNIWQYLDVSPW